MSGSPDDAMPLSSPAASDAPSSVDTSSGGELSREIPITNKRGLHARASAKFVQMVERFNAEITVSRNGETVGGTSIMGLMMLAAGIGTSIEVTAKGPEAQAALDAITQLVTNKFGEE
jgi:phosphocarrier protein